MPSSMLFDTHCHIDYLLREGISLETVLSHADKAGVGYFLNPGTDLETLKDVLAAAEADERIYAAAAIHPTDLEGIPDDWLTRIEQALNHPKVIALGETGLDYYREPHREAAYVQRQQQCFEASLALARQHDLPVIIHDREAHEDIRAMVKACPGVRGVMHCFSGDVEFATQMIDLGFYISFAGNVTFKNAKPLQETARTIPLEWLLVETDSPFLSPMPHRGSPNEPARVSLIATFIAQLRGISFEAVAEMTTANAKRLFKC